MKKIYLKDSTSVLFRSNSVSLGDKFIRKGINYRVTHISGSNVTVVAYNPIYLK